MSADNYMYVYRVPNDIQRPFIKDTLKEYLFVVVMRFASPDYKSDEVEWLRERDNPNTKIYQKLSEAIAYAHEAASGDFDEFGIGTEYGVMYSDSLSFPAYAHLIQVWEENPLVQAAIKILESKSVESMHGELHPTPENCLWPSRSHAGNDPDPEVTRPLPRS